MDRGITRHDGTVPLGAEHIGGAVGLRDDAACFANEQRARRNVPRRQLELPEAIEPARGDIRQIERGSAGPADAARRTDHGGELGEIDVQQIQRLEREAGPDESASGIGHGRNAQARLFLERATAANGSVRALATDIMDDAGCQFPVNQTPDTDGVLWIAMQEVGRPVERIDDPDELAAWRPRWRQLFPDDDRVRFLEHDHFGDEPFGGAEELSPTRPPRGELVWI